MYICLIYICMYICRCLVDQTNSQSCRRSADFQRAFITALRFYCLHSSKAFAVQLRIDTYICMYVCIIFMNTLKNEI